MPKSFIMFVESKSSRPIRIERSARISLFDWALDVFRGHVEFDVCRFTRVERTPLFFRSGIEDKFLPAFIPFRFGTAPPLLRILERRASGSPAVSFTNGESRIESK
jgi:hypothetical protein